MTLPCEQIVERLLDYDLGDLPAEEARAVDAHLSGCSNCTNTLSGLRSVPRAVRAALSQAALPPEVERAFLDQAEGLAGLDERMRDVLRRKLSPLDEATLDEAIPEEVDKKA